ncbi:hypothetical protein TNIN_207011 [Trichonephila inaurata madagascariensis]|uniref:Uncharacterized protein n=1 Tax=Trichonephila inaurata madagascariensis TaxID=2747483 RepID=A0A8X6XN35_9ARAC|nr:hypothetical protein TNIN_207011 [Trichonephila inaurata madagascariensis]
MVMQQLPKEILHREGCNRSQGDVCPTCRELQGADGKTKVWSWERKMQPVIGQVTPGANRPRRHVGSTLLSAGIVIKRSSSQQLWRIVIGGNISEDSRLSMKSHLRRKPRAFPEEIRLRLLRRLPLSLLSGPPGVFMRWMRSLSRLETTGAESGDVKTTPPPQLECVAADTEKEVQPRKDPPLRLPTPLLTLEEAGDVSE